MVCILKGPWWESGFRVASVARVWFIRRHVGHRISLQYISKVIVCFCSMILHHEIIMFGVFLELCSNHQRVANVRCRLGVSMGWSDIQFRWKYLGNLKVPPEQMPSTWGETPDPNIRPFLGEQWRLPSQSLTWKLKMMDSNRNLLFHGLIFRFHV